MPKYIFWNKRTHSDVVVGSRTLRTCWVATGHQQEGGTEAAAFPLPAREDMLLTKVTQDGDGCPSPGGGGARGGGSSGVRPQGKLRLPDGVAAV